jgi:hypothetical protein
MDVLLADARPSFLTAALIHYVALAHLCGGLMLAFGLLTRLAALIQIPVLFGAVFLVHLQGGLLAAGQSLEFSALVLVMLGVYFLIGSGRWSVDHYLFRQGDVATQHGLSERAAAILQTRRSRSPVPGTSTVAATPSALQEPTCSCGHTRTHELVTPDVRYSLFGLFYFLGGITAPPKEVVFRCKKCGEVLERSRDPHLLNHFRYRDGTTEPRRRKRPSEKEQEKTLETA